MDDDKDYIELVQQAQLGNRESLDTLAELVRARLYAYVYRIVLQEHLAQDIVQESMLEMFKVLGKLKRSDRFWPWLRGIAFNKMRRHYMEEKHRRTVRMSKPENPRRGCTEGRTGFANLVAEELKQVVISAMAELKPRYRKVLTMRCYEEMEYSEIAELMRCSELSARVLFCRAKRALHKRLSHKGFGKGFLVTALVLFGKMTAPSEAAAAGVSVTVATCKVGLAAGLVGAMSGKALVVSLTTASVLAVGTMVATSGVLIKTTAVSGQSKARELNVAAQAPKMSQAVGEYWYYFPEGVGGAVMMQQIRQSRRQWLQDEYANYHNHKDTISIRNCRMWHSDLSVWRLPTDGPQLTEFLSRVEGRSVEMEYVDNKSSGLLVIASSKEAGERNYWITRHYNVMDEDYFQSDWPKDTPTVDERDAMHKRGWTYFKITGQISGKEVRGRGRIPFVYAASYRHWPWVELKVADSIVNEADFAGLSRPWMGLHTIDTVRRDAAEKRIWFETKYDKRSSKAEVVLKPKDGNIIYTIDMEKDVIESITFSGDTGGQLQFDYLQEIDDVGSEFAQPIRKSRQQENSEGILWLLELIRNN